MGSQVLVINGKRRLKLLYNRCTACFEKLITSLSNFYHYRTFLTFIYSTLVGLNYTCTILHIIFHFYESLRIT